MHAASGGVGHIAVQVAKARGATVIGTASPANHAWLRELGADEVLDYSAGPVSKQLEDVGGKVDAVLDLIGGDALEDAPAQVHDTSRVVSIVDAATVLGIGGRYVFVRPEREHLDALTSLVDEGALRVTVAETFSLDQIADAHRLSEGGHPQGKVVVTL
ncbi:MAG: zinc-binding dehydrogenase [Nocardioides sp.]